MPDISLHVEEVQDRHSKENFDRLRYYFESLIFNQFEGRLMIIEAQNALTNEIIPHGLGFLPTDSWHTFSSQGAIVTFNYDKFTDEDICVNVSKASTVRLIVGALRGVQP